MDKVTMVPPYGVGEPKEVDATPEILTPMLVAGWTQCAPSKKEIQEVDHDVDH